MKQMTRLRNALYFILGMGLPLVLSGCATEDVGMVTVQESRAVAFPVTQDSPAILAIAEVTPDPEPDPDIEALLASLTLRQRIGQRFIAYIPGDRVGYGAGRAINSVSPAGFILYPWNFRTADDVRRLTGSLQFLAEMVTPGISLLLCTDQEGGRVDTFRFPEFVRFPAAAQIGRLDDPSIVRSSAYITSTQLKGLGLNMNLAPVLDVFDYPDDSIIGDRSYSGDPDTVSRFVGPYLEGTRAAGVIPTVKHYPGHGVTTVDSHHALPVVTTTREELFARDLIPFITAVDNGVEALMTGHILFENIDPFYPATLSEVFLRDILRDELGYQGVVVTDGLEMGAIKNNFSLSETLVRLFTLDVDLILLFTQYDVVDLVDLVEELIEAGAITEDDVDRGVRRVLRLKTAYGLARAEEL
ncbi:MAG: hypothetical protein E4H09_00045 [Spirochaetales bacterium]|nr:MAG: hypothetical protein E4H09_00045 [Spirochaetales bacterium]